ncbi:uncharacterized protein PFLUO_LOCUS4909 [Penicillium psychrofluorescens]|uniref:uncharacterized protein n=1 Tax=Penicillium psychrofluorescens TaxID=3158075 RepID=UPI003CCE1F3F
MASQDMFKRSSFNLFRGRRFEAVDWYWSPEDNFKHRRHALDTRLQYGSLKYDRELFISIICNEYALRVSAQRIEMLQKEIKALEKLTNIEVDQIQFAQLNTGLEEVQKKHSLQKHQLYISESMIPERPLKQNYDSLRRNPDWYMRHELIQDCKDRGGCCSRGCGCCAQRYLTSEKMNGIGHCTWDCWCCLQYRGFDLSAEEKEKAEKELGENLRSWNPAYLLKMTDGFFTKPGRWNISWIR